MSKTAGIVGVGNMGGAMAARLLERGWRVRVCDLAHEKVRVLVSLGAEAATTPAEAAREVAALIVCVVDAAQAQDVLFGAHGAVASLAAGTAVLLCPTIAPADTERLAARLAACGLAAIDAPMSGGPARARDGTMSLMLACTDTVHDACACLLQDLSSRVIRVGTRPGDGARTKLVNNLLAAVNLAGAAEAIALAERLGLDPARTLDVIEQSSGQSWIGSDRMRRALAGDFAPRAHVSLLHKDTRLALEAADDAGFDPALGRLAHDAFVRAVAAGWAEQDDAVLLRLLRR
jgi:3-hydroxyisobutyrate dehydrogenase